MEVTRDDVHGFKALPGILKGTGAESIMNAYAESSYDSLAI
ncbi:MAG: hypothetical protein ACP5QI_07350 [Candidatus Bathyarchaeia archaeon]